MTDFKQYTHSVGFGTGLLIFIITLMLCNSIEKIGNMERSHHNHDNWVKVDSTKEDSLSKKKSK